MSYIIKSHDDKFVCFFHKESNSFCLSQEQAPYQFISKAHAELIIHENKWQNFHVVALKEDRQLELKSEMIAIAHKVLDTELQVLQIDTNNDEYTKLMDYLAHCEHLASRVFDYFNIKRD